MNIIVKRAVFGLGVLGSIASLVSLYPTFVSNPDVNIPAVGEISVVGVGNVQVVGVGNTVSVGAATLASTDALSDSQRFIGLERLRPQDILDFVGAWVPAQNDSLRKWDAPNGEAARVVWSDSGLDFIPDDVHHPLDYGRLLNHKREGRALLTSDGEGLYRLGASQESIMWHVVAYGTRDSMEYLHIFPDPICSEPGNSGCTFGIGGSEGGAYRLKRVCSESNMGHEISIFEARLHGRSAVWVGYEAHIGASRTSNDLYVFLTLPFEDYDKAALCGATRLWAAR